MFRDKSLSELPFASSPEESSFSEASRSASVVLQLCCACFAWQCIRSFRDYHPYYCVGFNAVRPVGCEDNVFQTLGMNRLRLASAFLSRCFSPAANRGIPRVGELALGRAMGRSQVCTADMASQPPLAEHGWQETYESRAKCVVEVS